MSRVQELLAAFTAEFHEAGDADPRPYLRELSGGDRAELTALIDHFLATEPPPEFDAEAFAASRAQHAALVDRLLDPSLLDLRRAAQLTKADVGARLAAELGLQGQAVAAKGAYHEIESGTVAPERVRERIWTLLATLYDTSAERLREATRSAFEARPAAPAQAFARSTQAAPVRRRAAAAASGDDAVRRAFFVD